MHLTANEATMPRLHLIGTLALVLVVTLAMAGFYSWQNEREQRSAFERIESVITRQQNERLGAEMQSAMDYLEFLRLRTEEALRRNAVEQVDSALQVAQAIYDHESSRHPPKQVQKLIIETLRPVRFFDDRGYFFIDDMQGRFVLLPIGPEWEGRTVLDNRDDQGTYIMRGLIDAARQPQGTGFHRYRWYRPDMPSVMADKIAYVRYFAPFDWLIGAGDYLYEWERLQQNMALQRLRALRFGASGAIGVMDSDGRLLLSPNDAALQGLLPADVPRVQRQALEKIRATAQAGGGIVEYEWPRSGEHANAPPGRKTALVSTYAPWGWSLVVTMFNDELRSTLHTLTEAEQQGQARRRIELALMLAAALALGLAGSFGFSRWSRRLFTRYRRELDRAHQDLRIAATAFESQEGIFVTDVTGKILRVNGSFTHITGYSADEVIGQTPALLKSGRHGPDFYGAMRSALEATGQWSGEIWNRRKDGTIFPEWLTVTAVKNDAGEVTHYVSTLTDITLRKAAEEEIRHLAFYDPLTRLPNRRLLLDRLRHALLTCRRTQHRGALMFIDLDNFKLVNDSMGHDRGDLLLQEMGRRLVATVRQGDTVARLGGDEFVVVLEDLNPEDTVAARQAETVAEKMLQSLASALMLDDQEIQISCSIGVVLFNGDSTRPEDLMKHADLAMYQAKESGRNAVRFFDPEMHAAVVKRMALEQDLRTAMQDGQLRLFYQPQVNEQGQVIGAESLARWLHPERGMISPGEFIPLAEECGLILPLGQWVLHTACEQLARWAREPGREHLTLAVNVSGRQLHQKDFVTQVLQTLAHTGAPAHRLKLELTESMLLEHPEDAISKMKALKEHGVGFSLDDFGTGYSSLALLRQLPLGQLKIDQSFVHNLVTDPRAAAIVRTIVTLADNLDMGVIAEGVETHEQREHLARGGCHSFQGYLFGRPVPMEEWMR
ncbi:bifunctional diguanylate cyclase/phosphodiesterase [Diaphorobacter sp.]|uniref:bifunctional diguanylate cyclase/phosphodiesterase n=1 Tax=Diaphorobacter sp. TaxID=1934310 RepID=UPI003D0CE157